MYYDVKVTALIRQTLPDLSSSDMPVELRSLFPPPSAYNETRIVSEGRLTSVADRATLSFSDGDDRGYEISFVRPESGLITLRRYDPGSRNPFTVVLEENVRHRCIKPGKNGDKLELITVTERIDNQLMKKGKMFFRFSVEICGVRAERAEFNVEITHTDADEE